MTAHSGMGMRLGVFVAWQGVVSVRALSRSEEQRTKQKDVIRMIGTHTMWIALLTCQDEYPWSSLRLGLGIQVCGGRSHTERHQLEQAVSPHVRTYYFQLLFEVECHIGKGYE